MEWRTAVGDWLDSVGDASGRAVCLGFLVGCPDGFSLMVDCAGLTAGCNTAG